MCENKTKSVEKVKKKREVYAPVDEVMLFKLAQTMLTIKSISIILDCSEQHLNTKYHKIIERGRENRRYSLVEAMWSKALDDKCTKMQIWMSKQHLGYKDNYPDQAQQVMFNVVCNEVPR